MGLPVRAGNELFIALAELKPLRLFPRALARGSNDGWLWDESVLRWSEKLLTAI